jgi:hypothetical protein
MISLTDDLRLRIAQLTLPKTANRESLHSNQNFAAGECVGNSSGRFRDASMAAQGRIATALIGQ